VHDGEDRGSLPYERGKRVWNNPLTAANSFHTRERGVGRYPHFYRACLMRAV